MIPDEIPAENNHYDPGHEPVTITDDAPLKNRICSAIAKFLFVQASKFESRAAGYLFVSPRRLKSDIDLTPVLDVVDPRAELRKALENDDVRAGVLLGYNIPRRTEAEQLELIHANTAPAVDVDQHEFVWAGMQPPLPPGHNNEELVDRQNFVVRRRYYEYPVN